MAHRFDESRAYQSVPFRGETNEAIPDRRERRRPSIYPTPGCEPPLPGLDPARWIEDEVIEGPNAMLEFRREVDHRTADDPEGPGNRPT